MLYVGWDWASETHDVMVMGTDAVVVDRRMGVCTGCG